MRWRPLREPGSHRILLVGEGPGRPQRRLREILEGAGYSLRFCAGPASRPCPVDDGGYCTVRGHPELAMIVRAEETEPLPPCGRALGIPAVGIREDWESRDEPPLLPAPPSEEAGAAG